MKGKGLTWVPVVTAGLCVAGMSICPPCLRRDMVSSSPQVTAVWCHMLAMMCTELQGAGGQHWPVCFWRVWWAALGSWAGGVETGSGSREAVLLSHEQFVCFQLSMGCWRPRAVPFVTGVLGLPGSWLRECLLPTVDQEIRVSDTTRLEWVWLDCMSKMLAHPDRHFSRLQCLGWSVLAPSCHLPAGIVR